MYAALKSLGLEWKTTKFETIFFEFRIFFIFEKKYIKKIWKIYNIPIVYNKFIGFLYYMFYINCLIYDWSLK